MIRREKIKKKHLIGYAIDRDLSMEPSLPITLIKYLIAEKAQNWSSVGYSFSTMEERLDTIKSMLIDAILVKENLIHNLQRNFILIQEEEDVKQFFLHCVKKSSLGGFFQLKERLIILREYIDSLLSVPQHKQELPDTIQKEILMGSALFREERMLQALKDRFLREEADHLLSLLKMDGNAFSHERMKIEVSWNFIIALEMSKVYDLGQILSFFQDTQGFNEMVRKKRDEFEFIKKENDINLITKNFIDEIFEEFTRGEEPFLVPNFVNTFNTTHFAKLFLNIILRRSQDTESKISFLTTIFPRVNLSKFLEDKTSFPISLSIYLPILRNKKAFYRFLKGYLGKSLASCHRYISDGFFPSYSIRDYYDFKKKAFFYTPHFFKAAQNYIKNLQKEFKISDLPFIPSVKGSLIDIDANGLPREGLDALYDILSTTRTSEHFPRPNDLLQLQDFHDHLLDYLLNTNLFKEKLELIKEYVDKVLFFPKFQAFHLSKYYLYIKLNDFEILDLKLLFLNTFQKIYTTAADISKEKMLFMEFLFPNENPNMRYLNWLSRSKKAVSEMILFKINRVHPLFHFSHGFENKKWIVDAFKFRNHVLKVLRQDKRSYQSSPSKDPNNLFILEKDSIDNHYSRDTEEFRALKNIYRLEPEDLSLPTLRNYKMIVENYQLLLRKGLIFPHVDVKNLGEIEEIHLILLDTKERQKELLEMFKFFNFGFIHEINGEYFTFGQKKSKKMSGLYIKLLLPNYELNEIIDVVEHVLIFYGIEQYLLLSDLVEIPEVLPFTERELEGYSPLNTLPWNNVDKRYMNYKLFTEDFTPIYPPLHLKEDIPKEDD